MKRGLTIVMPSYNEAGAVGAVVEDVLAHFPDAAVIVVDDGSKDDTPNVLKKFAGRVTIERFKRNRGYGFALKHGIALAETEFVAIMDGDGQHTASDLKSLWEKTTDQDMIVGARAKGSNFPLLRRPGKAVLKIIAEYLAGQPIPDLNSGMRIFRTDVIKRYFTILPDAFSFSTTSTVAFLKDGAEVEYLPIKVLPRVGTSTVSMKTGFETIILLLRLIMLFEPLKIFLLVSLVNGIFAVTWASREYMLYHGFGATSIILALSTLILFLLGLVSDQISMLRRRGTIDWRR